MAVNKVVINHDGVENVLVDITDSTVTPETLAEGETAYGANGEKIMGTMKAGGGLPDAVSAMDSGTYTPASDLASEAFIDHKLGVKPDFAVCFIEGTVDSADYNGYSVAQCLVMQPHVQGSSTYTGFHYNRYSSNSVFGVMTSQIGTNTRYFATNTNLALRGTSNAKLKAGATYRWIVGKFA